MTGPTRTRLRPRKGKNRRVHPGLWLFPLPALVIYGYFFAMPTLEAFRYAATDWDGYSPTFNQVGFGNFADLFAGDQLFVNALGNNLKFLLVVLIFQSALSLGLSLLLVRHSRGSVFLRALFFLPTILSSVSVAFVWRFVYDSNFGLLNRILGAVGLESWQMSYLADSGTAIYFVALTQVWAHAGQMMVVFIAGLQQIPAELYESARVDGAGRWARFRYVTWPMIAPATAIVMAYTTIQSFKAFDLILGLGGNPPKPGLDILSTRIYTTFANAEFGYAAAESLLFMGLIVAVTLLQRRMVRFTQRSA